MSESGGHGTSVRTVGVGGRDTLFPVQGRGAETTPSAGWARKGRQEMYCGDATIGLTQNFCS